MPMTYRGALSLDGVMTPAGEVCFDSGVQHWAWLSRTARRQYVPALRELLSDAPPPAHVLDWGSGYGLFSRTLIELGYSVTGFDFFEDLPTFKDVRSSGPWTYVCAGTEAVRLPFDAATFDVVTSIGVLEHVAVTGGEEVAALRELRRVVKPDGILLVSHLPNKYSLIEFAARRISRGHTFRYTQSDLEHLLAAGGWRLDHVWRQGMIPRNTLSRLAIADSRAFAGAIDLLDAALGSVAGPLSQNWGAIARPV